MSILTDPEFWRALTLWHAIGFSFLAIGHMAPQDSSHHVSHWKIWTVALILIPIPAILIWLSDIVIWLIRDA